VTTERYRISTERLLLEPLRMAFAKDLWRVASDSNAELSRWLAWAIEPDREASFRFYRSAERNWGLSGWIFVIRHEGDVVGLVDLNHYVPLVELADVGYWLSTSSAGRGFMTEALSGVVEFGFQVAGLHRIQLTASPANIASCRVAEKVGFQPEGLRRDGSRGRAGWHDVRMYGLLATDPRLRLPITVS
jgi:RimJ/RimL family protein N-acetyltransferase